MLLIKSVWKLLLQIMQTEVNWEVKIELFILMLIMFCLICPETHKKAQPLGVAYCFSGTVEIATLRKRKTYLAGKLEHQTTQSC